jgi:hypothetical protein
MLTWGMGGGGGGGSVVAGSPMKVTNDDYGGMGQESALTSLKVVP